MAQLTIRTASEAEGTYLGLPAALEATAVDVLLDYPDLSMTFESDSPAWPSTQSSMGYTITILNESDEDFTLPISVSTDAYPVELVTVDDTSVKLNGGTTGFTASVANGVLTVDLEGVVTAQTNAVITFQVNRGATP